MYISHIHQKNKYVPESIVECFSSYESVSLLILLENGDEIIKEELGSLCKNNEFGMFDE